MFGEYGLYLDGMFFAVICDDELFIKPTQAALAACPELPLGPAPYAGARRTRRVRVEDTDDAAALCALARLTCEALAELPQPKRRKRNAP